MRITLTVLPTSVDRHYVVRLIVKILKHDTINYLFKEVE